jgi:hypothetical protein
MAAETFIGRALLRGRDRGEFTTEAGDDDGRHREVGRDENRAGGSVVR